MNKWYVTHAGQKCWLQLFLVAILILAACKQETHKQENIVSEQISMDHPQILAMLFHPRSERQNTPPKDADDIDVAVAENIHIGCRLFTHSKTAPTIIYYHGNGETVPDYDEIGPMYTSQGLNLLVTDFRGYGWSDGTPTTSTLLEDSKILFTSLKSWLSKHQYDGSLFVMGRSLGSACAIEVAIDQPDAVSGLIIESGFADTLPLAKTLGLDLTPFGITEEQTFNNGGKISTFKKPTFILHGQIDQLIPLWQGEKLQAQSGARTKEFQIVPGADHNSLIAVGGVYYFQAIKKFVDKVTGATPDWRERRKQQKANRQ